MKVKEESEKAGLKLNIQKKTKILASVPLLHGKIEGEKVEAVSDTFFLHGLQNHYKQWLQSWNYKMLAPWRENLRQHIEKQKYLFADKGP